MRVFLSFSPMYSAIRRMWPWLFLFLITFHDKSFSVIPDASDPTHASCSTLENDEYGRNTRKHVLKTLFFCQALGSFFEWHEEHKEKAICISGPMAMRYHEENIFQDLDEIHILVLPYPTRYEEDATDLFFRINSDIQKVIYNTAIDKKGDIVVTGFTPLMEVKKEVKKEEESPPVESLQSDQVTLTLLTLYFNLHKLASIRFLLVPEKYKDLTFRTQLFRFPDKIAYFGNNEIKIPILDKASYILQDKIALSVELDKIALSLELEKIEQRYKEQSDKEKQKAVLVKTTMHAFRTLKEIKQRLPFYEKCHGSEDLLGVKEKLNELARELKRRDYLASLIHDSALTINYKLAEGQKQDASSTWASRVAMIKRQDTQSVYSFEQLEILIKKDMGLIHIAPDGNCFYQAVANVINSSHMAKSDFIASVANLNIKTNLSLEKEITQQDIRIFIHHWIKEAHDLTQKDENNDSLSSLISHEEGIDKILIAGYIKTSSTPDSYNHAFYGWTSLLFPVALSIGRPIIVLSPIANNISSAVYSPKIAFAVWPALITFLEEKSNLILKQKKEVITDALFIAHSGGDHFFSCIPTQAMTERLKEKALCEEYILSGNAESQDSSFSNQPLLQHTRLSQDLTNKINTVLSSSEKHKESRLPGDSFLLYTTNQDGTEKSTAAAPGSGCHDDVMPEKKAKKKKKKKKSVQKDMQKNDVQQEKTPASDKPEATVEALPAPEAQPAQLIDLENLAHAMDELSFKTNSHGKSNNKKEAKKEAPPCKQTVAPQLQTSAPPYSRTHPDNFTNMEKLESKLEQAHLNTDSQKATKEETLYTESEIIQPKEQSQQYERPVSTDRDGIKKIPDQPSSDAKNKKEIKVEMKETETETEKEEKNSEKTYQKKQTQGIQKKEMPQASPPKKPAPRNPQQQLELEDTIGKTVKLIESQNNLQDCLKERLRNNLMEIIFKITKKPEEKKRTNEDKNNDTTKEDSDSLETSSPKSITVDVLKCSQSTICKGLKLADSLGDPFAPLIIGMILMSQFDNDMDDMGDMDDVIGNVPLKIINLFDRAASRGKVEGSLMLYGLALHKGSPEAFSCSLLAINNIDPIPVTPSILFSLPAVHPLHKINHLLDMPLRIKAIVSSCEAASSRSDNENMQNYLYHRNLYYLNKKHPKSFDLQQQLTPDLLFREDIEDILKRDDLESTLINMAHMGYVHVHRGQIGLAVGEFLPAAIAYTLLLQTTNKIANITKAAGLAATYHCLLYFDEYRKENHDFFNKNKSWYDSEYESEYGGLYESESESEGIYRFEDIYGNKSNSGCVSLEPTEQLIPWTRTFKAIEERLSYHSRDHYIYSLLKESINKPLIGFKSILEYIVICRSCDHQFNSFSELNEEIRSRTRCFTGCEPEFLSWTDTRKPVVQKRESGGYFKNKKQASTPKKTQVENKKFSDQNLGDVIRKLSNNIASAKINIKDCTTKKDINISDEKVVKKVTDELGNLTAAFRALSNISNELTALNKEKKPDHKNLNHITDKHLDRIFFSGMLFFDTLNTYIFLSKKLTHDDANAILLFQQNVVTMKRFKNLVDTEKHKLLQYKKMEAMPPRGYVVDDFPSAFLSSLDPANYVVIDRDLLIMLMTSLAFNQDLFFTPDMNKDAIESVIDLLSEGINYFDHHQDLRYILSILMAINGYGEKYRSTASETLIKMLIYITREEEFQSWCNSFKDVSNIISNASTSSEEKTPKAGFRKHLEASWNNMTTYYLEELENILKERKIKNQELWEQLIREEEKEEKRKKENKMIKKTRRKDKSAQHLQTQEDGSDTYENDEENNEAELSNDITENQNDVFYHIYTHKKEHNFCLAIEKIEEVKRDAKGDSLVLAKADIVKAGCQLQKFTTEVMPLNKIKQASKIAEQYAKQYEQADRNAMFPRNITSDDLYTLYEETLLLSNELDNDDNLLILAIGSLGSAKECMETFILALGADHIHNDNQGLFIKEQYELLTFQIDEVVKVLDYIYTSCNNIEKALNHRKSILKQIRQKREKRKDIQLQTFLPFAISQTQYHSSSSCTPNISQTTLQAKTLNAQPGPDAKPSSEQTQSQRGELQPSEIIRAMQARKKVIQNVKKKIPELSNLKSIVDNVEQPSMPPWK